MPFGFDADHFDEYNVKYRGVGTCVRVGGKTKSGGSKDMNFKEKPIFFSNFG